MTRKTFARYALTATLIAGGGAAFSMTQKKKDPPQVTINPDQCTAIIHKPCCGEVQAIDVDFNRRAVVYRYAHEKNKKMEERSFDITVLPREEFDLMTEIAKGLPPKCR